MKKKERERGKERRQNIMKEEGKEEKKTMTIMKRRKSHLISDPI